MARVPVGQATKTGVQNSTYSYAADAEASDAYAITVSPAPTAYAAGQRFLFKANTANTGASSLNVNGLGAKTLKKENDQDTATGDIEAGSIVEVVYDGTNFQITSTSAATGSLDNVVEDTTPQLGGDLDGQGNDLTNMGVLFLTEQAAAEADVVGKGQLWVQTATPNVLMFTDDAGTDFTIAHNATTSLPSLGTVSTALTGVLRADSGVLSVDADVTDLVTAATTSAAGKVELATVAETNTGTDTARAVTPDSLSGAKRTIILSAAGAKGLTTAGAAGPTQVEAATNDINYFVMDFDTTTEEHCFWSFPMPDSWDAGVVNAIFYWTTAAGLATETVVWGIAGGSWGDNDAIDAALGTEVTVTDTFIAQGDLHISAESGDITIANAAAGEWVNIVVARKTASDNLTGDARLIMVKLEYTIDAYSD